ncbi:ATP-dependent zinc metalloprotease FTSH 4, mitochondrial [Agyrium rufum]|nr:ATP-dependent zinc metalloprotease FTSH 4, mitochondrial [Agyrium rufum]
MAAVVADVFSSVRPTTRLAPQSLRLRNSARGIRPVLQARCLHSLSGSEPIQVSPRLNRRSIYTSTTISPVKTSSPTTTPLSSASRASILPSPRLLSRAFRARISQRSMSTQASRPKLSPPTDTSVPTPYAQALPPFSLRFAFFPPQQQIRTLFGSGNGSSQNLLAHMEQTANNNPTSATAQNAFYAALLRANMPAIVVERYQTGRYASNAACEATFQRALERMSQSGDSMGMGASNQGNMQNQLQSWNQEQMQAIGQAVAAQSRGGQISMARGKSGAQGTGAKDSPLYVVVEESLSGTVFKWVKFLLYFGLVTYFSLVVVTLIIETTGVLKKVSGINNTEAQAAHQTVRFTDVHGCDEAKEELQELVEFLKAPERFSTLGGKLPKGVLLVGPPGTGKTLLARAVAGEAGVPFFFMSGSEFDEVYVGVGAKRVRELFNAARAKSPSIIFIDELDAIGGKRNERDAAYVKQTLNQLLTELDGFSQQSGVIILAATNFPQLLDKALTRPGRFDRNVVVPLPDVRGRMAILKHHMRKMQISTDVDDSVIARGTPGFSGADLENLVNQAAVRASRNHAQQIGMLDFEWAKDKILMGAERRSAVIQDKDKLMTAYHEGGHALVAMFTDGADPLYKATIMPRGQALGITFQLPDMDKVSMSKKECLAKIDVCMAGKAVEELIYGPENVTSGSSSDIQQATSLAYSMVTRMGFSSTLGNVDLASDEHKLSSETKKQIEHEVRALIDAASIRATNLIKSKRHELEILARALVEYEVLNLEEMQKVLRGEKLPKLAPSLNAKLDGNANNGSTPKDNPSSSPNDGGPKDGKDGKSGGGGGGGGKSGGLGVLTPVAGLMPSRNRAVSSKNAPPTKEGIGNAQEKLEAENDALGAALKHALAEGDAALRERQELAKAMRAERGRRRGGSKEVEGEGEES